MMRNIRKTLMALVLSAAIMPAYIHGQSIKFGHINSSELLALMPEKKKAEADMQGHAKELESQLKAMSAEYETKLQDYQAKQNIMTDPVKQTKIREITDLETRIQEFQSSAQESLQKKQDEVLAPIIEKAKKAIKEVAKDNGYTYVFDTSSGFVLSAPDSDNLLSLVKKKMGL